jgi:hypothetical protein
MNQSAYFKIDHIGEVALIDLAGIWTKETAYDYHKAVLEHLDAFKNQKVFPISNMVNWSLPSFEVMEITNQISLEIAEHLDYKHFSLLAQKRNLQLFEEVINQFNLVNTKCTAKSFLNLSEALDWGKEMGYQVDQVPRDYFS